MTRKGLEHQFLSLAIKSEKPQLEEDMISSVKKEESLRLKVIALEDELLTLLATSEGNILNNDKLIESLKNSKKSTKEAKKTLDEIKETKVKLEDERNIYFTLAQVLFIHFLMEKLSLISNFSLAPTHFLQFKMSLWLTICTLQVYTVFWSFTILFSNSLRGPVSIHCAPSFWKDVLSLSARWVLRIIQFQICYMFYMDSILISLMIGIHS